MSVKLLFVLGLPGSGKSTIAREIATRVNAMVAPAVPYGFTGVLDAYPGWTIPASVIAIVPS